MTRSGILIPALPGAPPRALWLATLTIMITAAGAAPAAAQSSAGLPECEWCGTSEAPRELSWSVTVADESEPGERMVLRGVVYHPDGDTPASDVLLYLYHTNAKGIYATRGDETGNGRRHGHLRGWLRTDERGRYEIHTIRPGQYPGQKSPAHIHMTVEEPGEPEYWLPSFQFADDPYKEDDGRHYIIDLQKGKDGAWRANYDIVLPEEHPR